MVVVAVAGMPGSGKSTLMNQYQQNGYERFDDFNKDWGGNLSRLKAAVAQGKNAMLSDIEFCREDMRLKLERDLGSPVQWIFFENNPYQCAKNVLFRTFV